MEKSSEKGEGVTLPENPSKPELVPLQWHLCNAFIVY